jgi:hypothetical protein
VTRILLALTLALAIPTTAAASLGGTVATVEADRVQTKSALIGITTQGAYTVHTILSPTGTTIREFYGSNGVVFGVAWQGPWQPDLRQLFGSYFDPYLRAVQTARKAHKVRGHVAVDDGNVVVQIGGHLQAIVGTAYVPQLIPAGVDPGVVR